MTIMPDEDDFRILKQGLTDWSYGRDMPSGFQDACLRLSNSPVAAATALSGPLMQFFWSQFDVAPPPTVSGAAKCALEVLGQKQRLHSGIRG